MTDSAEYETDAWGVTGIPDECAVCYGTGIDYGETCLSCGGYGFICYTVED